MNPASFVRALIHEAIETDSETDADVIAQRIILRLDGEQCREALAACLPNYVRQVITARRSAARQGAERPTTVGESRRRRALNELYELVQSPKGGYKRLGDCTADDLEWLAAYHDDKASQHQAIRDRYERYARLVRDRGVATLRDAVAPKAAAA